MTVSRRVVGYERVSTREQGESGLGLDAQSAAIDHECSRNGFDLVDVVVDADSTGKHMDRPGVQRVLRALARGDADTLIVAKLDRLTRSAADFALLMDWLRGAGVTFIALDLGLDTSTPAGELVAGIMAQVAQWERTTIAARTRDALAAKRARGEAICRPSIADQPELQARVKALRASGLTYQAIADVLNSEGVPTIRGAKAWTSSSVGSACGWRGQPKTRRVELPVVSRRRRRSA